MGKSLVAAALLIGAAIQLPAVDSPAFAFAPVPPASSKGQLVELGDGAVAFVPSSLRNGQLTPVMVMLHGAGGNPKAMIKIFRGEAERRGVALLGVKSRAASWDMIEALRAMRDPAQAAEPVTNIDEPRIRAALGTLSRCVNTDPAHLALAGFSDGASYALTVGAAHPEQYRTVLGFSPGIVMLTGDLDPNQRVFVSHGRKDSILPFADREKQLVPGLRSAGMNITFQPFDGDHLVPPEIVTKALDFFLEGLPKSGPESIGVSPSLDSCGAQKGP